LVYFSGGLCLTDLTQKFVSFLARRFGLSFPSESFSFLCQPIRESQRVLETATLHGAAPFHQRKAGAQPAFSSPTKATYRAVMD
jgi:hypothetical protein